MHGRRGLVWQYCFWQGRECVCAAVPCCIKEPTPNQKLLKRVKLFSTTSDPGLHGCASYHSYGLNLGTRQEVRKGFSLSFTDLNKCKTSSSIYPLWTRFLPQEEFENLKYISIWAILRVAAIFEFHLSCRVKRERTTRKAARQSSA